jgi:hypothetical protein
LDASGHLHLLTCKEYELETATVDSFTRHFMHSTKVPMGGFSEFQLAKLPANHLKMQKQSLGTLSPSLALLPEFA